MSVLRSRERRGRANGNLNPIVQTRNRQGTAVAAEANERSAVNEQGLSPKAEGIALLEGGDENNHNMDMNNQEEGVGERMMDDFDSGAKSANKGPVSEDESLLPCLKRLILFSFFGTYTPFRGNYY